MNNPLIAAKIDAIAVVADRQLMSQLAMCDATDLCYAYKSRVKKASVQLDKLARKQKLKPSYSLTSITDIVGLRLVCLCRKDIPEVLDGMLKLIFNAEKTLSPSPFVDGSVEEIIAYHLPKLSDPLVDRIASTVNSYPSLKKIYTPKPSDIYTSVHIVARLSVDGQAAVAKDNKELRAILKDEKYSIPIEIQLRCVYEDAWGEIDHKYRYSGKDQDSEGKTHNRTSVARHLEILKSYSDACADYADAISSEARNEFENSASSTVLPVSDDEGTVRLFKELGISKARIAKFTKARTARSELSNDEQSGHSLKDVADSFRELCVDGWESSQNEGERSYYFNCRMNEALCYLQSSDVSNLSIAKRMYIDILESYRNYPLVWYRLALTRSKLNEHESCIAACNEANALLKKLQKEKLVGSHKLPTSDFDHISGRISIIWGYALWKQSKICDPIDRCTLLKQAVSVTEEGLATGKVNLRTANNNLCYFLLEVLKFCTDLTVKKSKEYADKLSKSYSDLLEQIGNVGECNNVLPLDTCFQVAEYLKDLENKALFGQRIQAIVLNELSDSSEERDADLLRILRNVSRSM